MSNDNFINEVEKAIQQLKEVFYYPNLTKIKKIFPLYRYNQLYRAFPYFFMFGRLSIKTFESLNNLSFNLDNNRRGTLEHLINILNFGGLKIDKLINYYYEINLSTLTKTLKQFLWVDNNEILYNNINTKIKEMFNSLLTDSTIKKYPTNYFVFHLRPFYNLNETIWLSCFKENITVEEAVENIIRANTPVEIKFSVTILIGERINSFNLTKQYALNSHNGNYSFITNTNLNKSKLDTDIPSTC